ncbi:15830_t:CDS:1 [Funneliformis mosseae]|uniref:15830_t:CDS:1 n=1 Tax=Funneliformis mosseae TaxID=27381 RepID=A0A9N9G9C5_FUNMO|nr:15830_t:CDS:1 [Funneliformis mosseae]
MKELYEEIFLTLGKKANTLNYLVTYFEDYTDCESNLPTPTIPINFSKFHNLKLLKIYNYYLRFENQIQSSCYKNLRTLQVNYIQISTTICVIKNCEGHLRKILVNSYDKSDNYYEESLLLIRTVYEYCPLVEYLSLSFPKSTIHFVEFEKLLKACLNLKSLLLKINCYYHDAKSREKASLEIGKELSRILIKSAPDNLREIRLTDTNKIKFSLETLDAFLDNWRGRTPLSIIISDPLYKKEEYMEILNKYMDDGVIKEFKIGYSACWSYLSFED